MKYLRFILPLIACASLAGAQSTTFTFTNAIDGALGFADSTDAKTEADLRKAAALWLGEVDDLWRMGAPRCTGGPWKNTTAAANTPSDPYLMFRFDQLRCTS